MRLDSYIFETNKLKSRTYAQSLIKSGHVRVDGKIIFTCAFEVPDGANIEIMKVESFASAGGAKLEKAIKHFNIMVEGLSCIDLGCSNGGFTDCLLRHGAKSVLGVDVGECALDSDILNSGKVRFLRANARELLNYNLGEFDFLCADLSFISLTLVMPTIYGLLKESGEAVLLIKPQFEVGKSGINKHGIVKDENQRLFAVDKIKNFAAALGFTVKGTVEAPLVEAKNIEYLIYLKK